MNITRIIIDSSTRLLCYLKRNRRITCSGFPVKINLGCGLAVCRGWINIDGSLNTLIASWPSCFHRLSYRLSGASRYYSRAEYTALLGTHHFVHHDLSHGIPFPDGSVDFVYSSHFLEHLHKDEAATLLSEAYRVLRKGGTIRVCVPDLAFAVKLYGQGGREKMLDDYFFVEQKDSRFARHRYMYDLDLLSAKLGAAGFGKVVQCSYGEGSTPDLAVLDNRPEDTLFVEATK
jgi:predicted SAM-dependent methyltransferase